MEKKQRIRALENQKWIPKSVKPNVNGLEKKVKKILQKLELHNKRQKIENKGKESRNEF